MVDQKEGLRCALQALAQQADVQIRLFPASVVVADELALDFDNWMIALINAPDLTAQQRTSLDDLDRFLTRMSAERNAPLWSIEALSSSPEWLRIRELARTALCAFGWPVEVPPNRAAEFVSAGRSK